MKEEMIKWHQLDNVQITCTSLQVHNHASNSVTFLQAGRSS